MSILIKLIVLSAMICTPLIADVDATMLLKIYKGEGEEDFISSRTQLIEISKLKDIVVIASPGRSGSTLLTELAKKHVQHLKVFKTHLLPPTFKFNGKFLFIHSNPDLAAESALHRLLKSRSHGAVHFAHVESADREWFKKLGNSAKNQTKEENLLAYDALGCALQLQEWLFKRTKPSTINEANVLAIKFEHLWEEETIAAIKAFLKVETFELPPKRERGCEDELLTSQEIFFKNRYNLGSNEEPRYIAYDKARDLWKASPPFQFLKLRMTGYK